MDENGTTGAHEERSTPDERSTLAGMIPSADTAADDELDGATLSHPGRSLPVLATRFFSLSLDLLVTAGFDGFITAINPAWERLLGWTNDELRNRPYIELVHPDDRERTMVEATSLATGDHQTRNFEVRFRAKDGVYHWLLFSAQADVEEKLLYATAKDITDRKRDEAALRDVEERFRSAFENAAIGMSMTSTDGRFLRVNRALCEMTGYSKHELIDRAVRDITHPEHVESDAEAIRRMASGDISTFHTQKRYLRSDGTSVWVSLTSSVVPGPDGSPAYLISQMEDISERMRVEAELEQRAAALERSNAELEQFAYVASHDLTEPLRMISGFVQLLSERYHGRLDADADEFIDFTVEGVSRMQALIDDLLALSRVGRPERTPEPVDCTAAVEHARQTLAALIAESEATFEVERLPTVLGHERDLEQLFQNLVSNAVRFRGQAPPRVRIAAEPEGEMWRFAVVDNGIGIEPRHTERIFKVFQRLHGRDAYPGSTGIGLAICKKVVEGHGGRIWVEPAAGGGTAFLFTLPAVVQEPA